MKKIVLTSATLALIMVAGSAAAANSMYAGSFGLNVEVAGTGLAAVPPTPLISGKYFVSRDMAILGGAGFMTGGPSGSSTTTLAIAAGVRKYLKTEDYAPFIGAEFKYSTTSGTPSSNGMSLAAEAGAEYFLSKQFSVEGKAQFGYLSVDNGTTKSSYFGTTTAGLAVNFYF